LCIEAMHFRRPLQIAVHKETVLALALQWSPDFNL
jgi:hypothetical protein